MKARQGGDKGPDSNNNEKGREHTQVNSVCSAFYEYLQHKEEITRVIFEIQDHESRMTLRKTPCTHYAETS